MTKAEFIDTIQSSLKKQGQSLSKRETEYVIETVFDGIKASVAARGHFTWRGFGAFKAKTRAARQGRNPATGEPVQIAEKTVVTFKAVDDFVA